MKPKTALALWIAGKHRTLYSKWSSISIQKYVASSFKLITLLTCCLKNSNAKKFQKHGQVKSCSIFGEHEKHEPELKVGWLVKIQWCFQNKLGYIAPLEYQCNLKVSDIIKNQRIRKIKRTNTISP